jgi:DNA-directed RNA polymerase specialized sigma24 family protein
MISRNFTPEHILVDRLPFDDASAFKELSRRYCYSLYAYCKRKLNSEEDSKLIVRNVFISLWEERRSLPLNFSLPVYLSIHVRKALLQRVNTRAARKNNEKVHVNQADEKQRQIGKPVIDSYATHAMAGLLA